MQIGVVPQAPLLFNVSIAANICYGLDVVSMQIRQRDIEYAAKFSAAHDWISKLPHGCECLRRPARFPLTFSSLVSRISFSSLVFPFSSLSCPSALTSLSLTSPSLHQFLPCLSFSLPQTAAQSDDTMAGLSGCNLSASQQQQISIARMILRKPSVLLFDTSLSDIVEGEERSKTATALDKLVKHQHVTVVHCSSGSPHDVSWLKSHGYQIVDLNARNKGKQELQSPSRSCRNPHVQTQRNTKRTGASQAS